jgi:hypothetical protein
MTSILMFFAWFGLFWAIMQDIKEGMKNK